jgi:hypothetical protein
MAADVFVIERGRDGAEGQFDHCIILQLTDIQERSEAFINLY